MSEQEAVTGAGVDGGAVPASPALVGSGEATGEATPPSATPANSNAGNPYETMYSKMGDSEGNFNEGTRAYLNELGMDAGRVDRIMRQGNMDNAFKALDHSQSLIEKRDGVRDYIPDPTDEVNFNKWREEKGIPIDPLDEKTGYNFKAGLEEGVEPVIGNEVLNEIGTMLHNSNLPTEKANTLIETVNKALAVQVGNTKQEFTNGQIEREQKSYDEFMTKHGFEATKKAEQVGHINSTYKLDAEDPYDRMLMSHPKYLSMAVDLAAFSRLTATSPESGGSQGAISADPDIQIQQIMRDHPRGAWKRDPQLRGQMAALAKQAEYKRK